MNNRFKTDILLIIRFPLIIPLIVCYYLARNRRVIDEDLSHWFQIRSYGEKKCGAKYLLKSFAVNRDFRTQFYHRVGAMKHILCFFLRYETANDIESLERVGGGLVLVHAFGITINGYCSIGKNCVILPNVTLGYSKGSVPTIGDNVFIGAGAVIIGGVRIGNSVKIGAGAVVVDDVPDNCTIVSPKANRVII